MQSDEIISQPIRDQQTEYSANPVIVEGPIASTEEPESQTLDKRRHYLAAFFLSFMFGVFGVDRFYLGKWFTGFLKLISFGGFGLWALIDTSTIVSGAMRDKQGNELIDAVRYKRFARNFLWIFTLLGVILLILFVVAVGFAFSKLMSSGAINNLIPGLSGFDSAGGSTDYNQIFDLVNQMKL